MDTKRIIEIKEMTGNVTAGKFLLQLFWILKRIKSSHRLWRGKRKFGLQKYRSI